MNLLPSLKLCCSLMVVFVAVAMGAEDQTKALQAADDARVAAIVKMDKAGLDEAFSDGLRYAHSTGAIDDKAGYTDLIMSGRTKYVIYDYKVRDFTFPAPGIALMAGKVHIKSDTGGNINDAILGYLAVWREEKGKWKFLAWQSCKLPEAVEAK